MHASVKRLKLTVSCRIGSSFAPNIKYDTPVSDLPEKTMSMFGMLFGLVQLEHIKADNLAQLWKSTYDNQLKQSMYLSNEKHVSNMAGEHTLAEPKLKITP